MFTDKKLIILLAIILVFSFAAGLHVLLGRFLAERQNDAVEIVMDYSDIKRISMMDNIPMNNLLRSLKNIGVNSIALPEDTLDEMERRGELSWLPGNVILSAYRITGSSSPMLSAFLRRGHIDPTKIYVMFEAHETSRRIADELTLALGQSAVKRLGDRCLEVTDDEYSLAFLGIGINPNIYLSLKQYGFKVVPRLKNSFRLTGDKISRKLNLQMIMNDDDIIIFDEESILGHPYHVSATAKELIGRNIKFGLIEFSEQHGGRHLAAMMGERIARVHSITAEEMEIIPQKTALARWVRAVRERGVRVLYVRPYFVPFYNMSVSATNMAYLKNIAGSMEKAGFKVGEAKEQRRYELRMWQILALAFGVSASFLLLCGFFFRVPVELALSVFVIALFSILTARYFGSLVPARKIFALASAVIFPVLSVLFVFSSKCFNENKAGFAYSLAAFIKIVIISLCGAVITAGLLSSTRFMLGADLFLGVKAALVLPVIITAFYFFALDGENKASLSEMTVKVKEFLNSRVTLLHVLLGIFFLLFAAVFILRSGNFGIPVPGIERALRGGLDAILAVRPRTKEFLIGYPVLFLSAFFYARIKNWLWLALAVGVVAPVSVINTFSHIHSPVIISAVRTLNGALSGLFIGAGIGLFLAVLLKFADRAWSR